jgi:hypothetical protein
LRNSGPRRNGKLATIGVWNGNMDWVGLTRGGLQPSVGMGSPARPGPKISGLGRIFWPNRRA